MTPLSFNKAISFNSGMSVAFFDAYFSFSGRKYRVIAPCTVNGINGHHVEEIQVKQSIPLNILKVASFITGVVPLIMFVGKLIGRHKHAFFINQPVTPSKPQVKPQKKAAHKVVVLVANPQKIQERTAAIEHFKNNALCIFNNKAGAEKTFDLTLDEQQKIILEKINWDNPRALEGGKVVRGGCNRVFFLDCMPHVVFKPMDDFQKAQEYIDVVERAREVVNKKNLYTIRIPATDVIEVNERCVIIQEKMDLFAGSYAGQKGMHAYCWNDPELREYTKIVYSHLLTFISTTNFGDVKYDNIPFTREGQIALIDLDETSLVGGLLRGAAGKNNGFFNSIPLDMMDYYCEEAKSQLDGKSYQALNAEIPKIKNRLNRKIVKREAYLKYLSSHEIEEATQKINPDLPVIFADACRQQIAKAMVELLNDELEKTDNYALSEGRTIELRANIGDPLTAQVQNVWKSHHGKALLYNKLCNPDDPTPLFETVISEVATALINAGFIHRYKIIPHYHYAKIAC